MKSKSNSLLGAGLITAIAASLCCITPVLALISGASGAASAFSWMEPFRPYLIAITVIVLAFAWYQKLKPKKTIECDCEEDEKPKFILTKTFLGIVTVFAILMLYFPRYSSIFYPDNKIQTIVVSQTNIQTIDFNIKGMTCTSCEEHVNHEVNKLDGILNVSSSFEKGTSKVEFDNSKTSKDAIEKAINATGYKVVGEEIPHGQVGHVCGPNGCN